MHQRICYLERFASPTCIIYEAARVFKILPDGDRRLRPRTGVV